MGPKAFKPTLYTSAVAVFVDAPVDVMVNVVTWGTFEVSIVAVKLAFLLK